MLRPRLLAAMGVATLAWLLVPPTVADEARALLSWNAGGIAYLALSFAFMSGVGPDQIRARAARQDEGAGVILVIILVAAASSFAAIGVLHTTIKTYAAWRPWLFGLAGSTIVTSWLVTQVVFAVHYAHDFYQPDDPECDARNGLDFPGASEPDYWDFLYFSTSIGATSQTSDVAIRSRTLRRLVTLHCVVAFLFNTSVLALTINLAASAVDR